MATVVGVLAPSSERTRTRGVSSFLFNSTGDLVDLAVLRRLSFVVSPGRPRSALTTRDRGTTTVGVVSAITLRPRKNYTAISPFVYLKTHGQVKQWKGTAWASLRCREKSILPFLLRAIQ